VDNGVRGAGPVRRGPGRPRLETPSAAYLARRDEIVEVAAEVFRRRGYDAGSLDDVAAELELRRASLYHYVRSKAQLLYMIFDRAITTSLERLEEVRRIEDPRERLAALIRHQVRTVTEEPTMLAVFFDNRPRLDETYEVEIRAKERRYVGIYAEAVEAACKAGAVPELDARYAAQALLGMTSWTYKWFDPVRDDADDLSDTLIKLVLKR
jgi:AcrR family transcriptional regulator